MALEYFRNNPPQGLMEFDEWWNTLQHDAGALDVPLIPYTWKCPVAGDCVASVPDWFLEDKELLDLLEASTLNMVLYEMGATEDTEYLFGVEP